jgi:hypothetical protein
VHVDGDVVNGMAAYQPLVLVRVLCGGRMKTGLLCVLCGGRMKNGIGNNVKRSGRVQFKNISRHVYGSTLENH